MSMGSASSPVIHVTRSYPSGSEEEGTGAKGGRRRDPTLLLYQFLSVSADPSRSSLASSLPSFCCVSLCSSLVSSQRFSKNHSCYIHWAIRLSELLGRLSLPLISGSLRWFI